MTGQEPSLFNTVKPQVQLVIHHHPTGSDLVDVTVLDPKYPPELLKSQIDALARYMNSGANGVSLTQVSFKKNDPRLTFLRARFGMFGLIEGGGKFRVGPIAKAFAGAPAPFAIAGINVVFDDEKPSDQTLRKYALPGVVQVEAHYNQPPASGTEFRIELLTQEPARIEIPDSYGAKTPAVPVEPPKQEARNSSIFPLVAFLLAGALAVGLLVYFALLRMPAGRRK